MNLSAPFIRRPVATLLLSLAILLLGGASFGLLPVAPLPQMDFPTITVQASLPGASPQIMASSVATPLERSLGTIAGISQMNSRSSQGSTRIMIQFDLDRDINAAAREVQAAINASRAALRARSSAACVVFSAVPLLPSHDRRRSATPIRPCSAGKPRSIR